MTTALEGGERWASRPGRSLPPGTHCTGGWVVSLGRYGQVRKISPPSRFDLDLPARSQSLYRLRCPAHNRPDLTECEIMSTVHYNLETNTDRLHVCYCDITCLRSVSVLQLSTAALCRSCPFAVLQIGLASRSWSHGTLCSTQSACWKVLCSRRSKS